MSLSAAQFVYTNVEKKHSSVGRDGFQIWMRTRDALDEADETALQSRLGDFEERKDAASEPLARHLYFRLPSGRIALSRSVPLAETDKFNRTGRFYAHALVLEPADFRQLDNDPFAILDQVTFQATIDDGLKYGDAATGTIPPLSLAVRPAERIAESMRPEQLLAILPPLVRACGSEKPVIIGVPGDPAATLRLTRELFAWLPPTLRLACSFDTLSTGRSLTQVPFAIVGLPAAGPPRRYLNLLLFDVAKQAFAQPPPAGSPGLYDQWLANQVRQKSEPPPLAASDAAFHLGTCLDRGHIVGDELSGVDPPLYTEIAGFDGGVLKLERLLRRRLEDDVGSVLAPLLFSLAHQWLASAGIDGLRKLSEPFAPEVLLRWLLSVYGLRTSAEIQRKDEVDALREVLERTKGVEGEATTLHKKLALVLYRWGRRWPSLAKSVRNPKTIPDDIYEWFVGWALGTISVRMRRGAGLSAAGVWIGPEIEFDHDEDGDEARRLVAAMLGIDTQGDLDADGASLPPERWAWIQSTLGSWMTPG